MGSTVMKTGWEPEIVVGIDFGMTCTAVAYSMVPRWPDPITFQHWPGKMVHELANKVPTLISYPESSTTARAWGFLCDQENDDSDIKDFFKLNLDPRYVDDRPDAPSLEEARRWFQDYLSSIYQHIEETFSNSFPRWRSQRIEFIFSVPTTWKDPGIVVETEKLIRRAGFGKDGPYHRAKVGLTEAEAAAVYASKQQFEKDDNILICDAGGGTTDVNVLKLVSSKEQATKLHQLSWVEGHPVGSALIDQNFRLLLLKRLNMIQQHLEAPPEVIAEKMMQGRFERMKCAYDAPASRDLPTYPLLVPGLSQGCYFPEAEIFDSEMIITREDIKALFDAQIEKIFILIDEQLDRTAKNYPREHISYLVISGGLGSSPYVRKRLKSRYEAGITSSRWNTQEMKIVLVPEPQLSVVHGLVMDRVQSISQKTAIFDMRCCRASYGMLCKELYNESKHIGEYVELDSRDGKKYALNQIDWFIIQGKMVSINGVSKPFRTNLNPNNRSSPWKASIVMSVLPVERLPRSLKQDGAKLVCEVESTLPGIEMKTKNRHWYSTRPEYLRAMFDVKFIPGAAGLQFQLWSKDGRSCSTNHDAIEVAWDVPIAIASRDVDGTTDIVRDV